jgi:hypothetical protein
MGLGRPIVISSAGMKAMQFSSDFDKWAKENGIRDPFAVSERIFRKKRKVLEDGSVEIDTIPDPEEPTRKERHNYIKMRDEYVARRCFYEIGYDSFLFHTKDYGYEADYNVSYMRSLDEFVPCRSLGGQCRMDCHRFADCAINNTWKPD